MLQQSRRFLFFWFVANLHFCVPSYKERYILTINIRRNFHGTISIFTINLVFPTLENATHSLKEIANAITIPDVCTSGLQVCSAQANCVQYGNASIYECNCKPGFEDVSSRGFNTPGREHETVAHGTNCEDIDECGTGQKCCSPKNTCSNLMGGFRCSCGGNFDEAKHECTNKSACDQNPLCYNAVRCNASHTYDFCESRGRFCFENKCLNSNSCHREATCESAFGNYTCSCKPGFTGNGKNCTDIDECSTGTSICSSVACVNTVGSYNCSCPYGYVKEGFECYDINECASNYTCHDEAVCINRLGQDYICVCRWGWSGDGKTCFDLSAATTLDNIALVVAYVSVGVTVSTYIAAAFCLTAIFYANKFTEAVISFFEGRQ